MISHPPLFTVVRAVLTGGGHAVAPDSSDDEVAVGDLIVTTASDTPPAACRKLSAGGARVVVLSIMATRADRSRYALAGAAGYLEMTADAASLLGTVNGLLEAAAHPAINAGA